MTACDQEPLNCPRVFLVCFTIVSLERYKSSTRSTDLNLRRPFLRCRVRCRVALSNIPLRYVTITSPALLPGGTSEIVPVCIIAPRLVSSSNSLIKCMIRVSFGIADHKERHLYCRLSHKGHRPLEKSTHHPFWKDTHKYVHH